MDKGGIRQSPTKRVPPRKKPGTGNNKGPRTPQQLERQERVFTLNVLEGKTIRQIAAIEKIDTKTVLKDIRAEAARRAEERSATREHDLEVHLAKLDDLALKALQDRLMPGTGAYGAVAKALEMRAKLLGLDAPTKIDVGIKTFLDALEP